MTHHNPNAFGGALPALPPAPAASTNGAVPNTVLGMTIPGLNARAIYDGIAAGRWHSDVIRLVAHYVAKNWRDWEIQVLCAPLTLSGWTEDQTRVEVQKAIDGARAKWNIPNPSDEFTETAPPKPLAATPVTNFDFASIQRRKWLLGRYALRGYVSSFIAPPGAGKSTLTIEMAASVATGEDLLDIGVHEAGPVWIYNLEDDDDEMRRRLAAVLKQFGLPTSAIADKLFMDSGTERPLIVAKRVGNVIVGTPDVDACVAEIKAKRICLFIVDPLVETHEADENNNPEMRAVLAQYRTIAQRANCAVVVVHHTSKPPGGDASGHIGNLNAARGASSLQGVARVSFTLFGMTDANSKTYNIGEEDRRLYVRLDDAKANLSLIEGKPRWFKRVGVDILNGDGIGGTNGDQVGVLVPVTLEAVKIDKATANKCLQEIGRAWDDGAPYCKSPNGGEGSRGVAYMMRDEFGVPLREGNACVRDWLANGYLTECEWKDADSHKGTGLRLVRLLGP